MKEEGSAKTSTVKTYECGYRDITDSRSPPAWERLPAFVKEDHPLLIMVNIHFAYACAHTAPNKVKSMYMIACTYLLSIVETFGVPLWSRLVFNANDPLINITVSLKLHIKIHTVYIRLTIG